MDLFFDAPKRLTESVKKVDPILTIPKRIEFHVKGPYYYAGFVYHDGTDDPAVCYRALKDYFPRYLRKLKIVYIYSKKAAHDTIGTTRPLLLRLLTTTTNTTRALLLLLLLLTITNYYYTTNYLRPTTNYLLLTTS